MYNIIMITVLVVVIVAVVLWKKRSEQEQMELLDRRQQQGSVSKKDPSAAIYGDAPTLDVPLKELTTLDIPMIQARFQNLGLLNPLEQRHRDKLKRLTKEMCTSKKQGLWWAPLKDFGASLGNNKGDLMAWVINRANMRLAYLQEMVGALSLMIRQTSFQLERIEAQDGGFPEVDAQDMVLPSTLDILYIRGSAPGKLELLVTEEGIDLPHLIRQCNGLFQKQRLPFRLLLLAPIEHHWCVLFCELGAAERAAKSKWGQLFMPAKNTP